MMPLIQGRYRNRRGFTTPAALNYLAGIRPVSTLKPLKIMAPSCLYGKKLLSPLIKSTIPRIQGRYNFRTLYWGVFFLGEDVCSGFPS